MINLKFYIFICLINLNFTFSVYSCGDSSYHNLYSREIYKQETRLADVRQHANEGLDQFKLRIEGILVQDFIDQKRRHVEQRVASLLQRKIEILQKKSTDFEGARKDKAAATQIGFWGKIGNALGEIAQGKIGTGITTLVSGTGDIASKGIDDIMKKIQESGKDDIEIADLQMRRKRLLEGITTEIWHEFELAYIKRKRFMGKELSDSIENRFLTARAVDGPTSELYRAMFSKALQLPVASKKLGEQEIPIDTPTKNVDDCVKNVIRRLEQDASFVNYDRKVQLELKQLSTKLVYLSHLGDNPKPYLRRGYYFWGKPFSGKSNAAELLQKVLRLPTCEKRLYSAEDLSKNNLEGGNFWSPQVNIGWIAEALTTKVPNGETYNNIILIINELDRVFSSSNKVPEAFLLDFLDPAKKEIISLYFGGIPLDISRVTVIGTGNTPIFLPGDVVPIPRGIVARTSSSVYNSSPIIFMIILAILLRDYVPNFQYTQFIPLDILYTKMIIAATIIGLPTFFIRNYLKSKLVKQKNTSGIKIAVPTSLITLADPAALERRLLQIEFPEFKTKKVQRAILLVELERLMKFYVIALNDSQKKQFIKQALIQENMAEAIVNLGNKVHEYKMTTLA